MKTTLKQYLLAAALVAALLGNAANACTGIRLIAEDGTVIHARTMEFAIGIHSDVMAAMPGPGPRLTARKV